MAHLAFYRARGTTFDRLIRWRTRSPYSHVEIVLGQHWYAASNRDGVVRVNRNTHNPESWDLVPVDVSETAVVRWWAKTIGDKYDWLGIVGLAIGVPRLHAANRWSCGEWAAGALGLSRPYRYTPQKLYEWATAQQESTS